MKLLLLVIFSISLSTLSFRDNSSPIYSQVENNLIKRNDGAIYQKGIVNLKFKQHISSFTHSKFGIDKIDNILSKFDVTKVYQRFPLKQNVDKRVKGDEDLAKIFTFKYDADIDPTELSELVYQQNKDLIEWIEPDFVYEADYIPNDPVIMQQWHILKINCFQSWDITRGDTTVAIGIVDTGSDLDHPDLAANIKYNYADPINGIDDDGNGYIDDFAGWDFYYDDNDPNINGGSVHGSHVSGCASQVADNNVHGAGPGFKVKLRITKHAPDSPGELIYRGYDGIVYQYQNGAKVVNCSWGGGYSSFGETVINNAWSAGTIVVASMGNNMFNVPRYPASYDNAVAVPSTDPNDLKSGFSNYHSTADVCAPGSNILSTVYNNSYTLMSGTSMSAPITAGTVGLIRSRYPSWTVQQVVDRLILGVDSIYNINQQYLGLLGSGRINAFKCVSDLPIISVISASPNDSIYGNNDKILDIGERIVLILTYKNEWFAGNNISLRLTTTDPDVEILKDSIFVGNLSAYSTYTTSISNSFEVRARPSCPFDKNVTFRLRTSSNAYPNENANTINILFRQGWATHTINNLRLSLTRDGAIGKKTQPYGNGLYLVGYPNANQLLEGGLMAGVSNTKVSDVCRRQFPPNLSDTDFVGLSVYSMFTPGTISNQDGRGLFNDDGAGSNKIGIEIRPSSYAFSDPAEANYILLKYVVRNLSGAAISNMHVGTYVMFAPTGSAMENVTRLDTINKLGYCYNNSTPNPHLGIVLLTNQNINFRAIDGSEITDGFSTQEKWTALSSGISVPALGPGFNVFVIAGGPISLNNNDSTVVSFAVVKGNDLNDIRNNGIKARNKYNSVIGVEQISNLIPERFELYQNYPNPFNPSTKIKFALSKNDLVKLKIYDIMGREIKTLINQKLEAGTYEVKFDGSELATGVYFYRIESNYFTDVKKMVLIK